MRADERGACAEILKQDITLGVHDNVRLLNYCNALEEAAIKMWFSVTGQKTLTATDLAEIKETMKVALPPGSV